jgi:hypothetical protein
MHQSQSQRFEFIVFGLEFGAPLFHVLQRPLPFPYDRLTLSLLLLSRSQQIVFGLKAFFQ